MIFTVLVDETLKKHITSLRSLVSVDSKFSCLLAILVHFQLLFLMAIKAEERSAMSYLSKCPNIIFPSYIYSTMPESAVTRNFYDYGLQNMINNTFLAG